MGPKDKKNPRQVRQGALGLAPRNLLLLRRH